MSPSTMPRALIWRHAICWRSAAGMSFSCCRKIPLSIPTGSEDFKKPCSNSEDPPLWKISSSPSQKMIARMRNGSSTECWRVKRHSTACCSVQTDALTASSWLSANIRSGCRKTFPSSCGTIFHGFQRLSVFLSRSCVNRSGNKSFPPLIFCCPKEECRAIPPFKESSSHLCSCAVRHGPAQWRKVIKQTIKTGRTRL